MIIYRAHAAENYHHQQAVSMILLMIGYRWSDRILKTERMLGPIKHEFCSASGNGDIWLRDLNDICCSRHLMPCVVLCIHSNVCILVQLCEKKLLLKCSTRHSVPQTNDQPNFGMKKITQVARENPIEKGNRVTKMCIIYQILFLEYHNDKMFLQ